ncbi:MAG: DUF177 domain-containing protein [Oscillospiraceae bacterium]|nr:DUF177 domain-containing protein [Oscillospiraceae bacterium]
MKLDIRTLDGAGQLRFDEKYDLSGMEFFGHYPIAEPLRFSGRAAGCAGGLVTLEGELSTRLHLLCDRCGREFTRDKAVPVSVLLELTLQDEERGDIVVCPGGICDLEDIAVPEWILAMDYQNLCREDCEGLLPREESSTSRL